MMTMLLGAWHHQAERTTTLVSSTLSSRALKWRKERGREREARTGVRETVSVVRVFFIDQSLFLTHTCARAHIGDALDDEISLSQYRYPEYYRSILVVSLLEF